MRGGEGVGGGGVYFRGGGGVLSRRGRGGGKGGEEGGGRRGRGAVGGRGIGGVKREEGSRGGGGILLARTATVNPQPFYRRLLADGTSADDKQADGRAVLSIPRRLPFNFRAYTRLSPENNNLQSNTKKTLCPLPPSPHPTSLPHIHLSKPET